MLVNSETSKRSRRQLVVGTWNVKGLTDEKLFCISTYMRQYRIDILCLQETWALKTEQYCEDGFYVILSGSNESVRSWAGVGFIIAPWSKHLLRGFFQYSERLVSVRIRTRHGTVGIINCYAPHNLKPHDEKTCFYTDLGKLWERTSTSGAKYLFGDFNARIAHARLGETDIFGPYGFGQEAVHQVHVSNREFLLEFCVAFDYMVANMMQQTPDSQKVTFVEPGTSRMEDVSPHRFAMLDLVLVPQECAQEVLTVVSVREAVLATDRFLVYCALNCDLEGAVSKPSASKNRMALQTSLVRQRFIDTFIDTFVSSAESAPIASIQSRWENILLAIRDAERHIPDMKPVAKKPWIRESTMKLLRDARMLDYVRIVSRSVHSTRQLKGPQKLIVVLG